jgi:hypothetical protein
MKNTFCMTPALLTSGLSLSLCLSLVACAPPTPLSNTPNSPSVSASATPAVLPSLTQRSLKELEQALAQAEKNQVAPVPVPSGLPASEQALYRFGPQLPQAEREQIARALDQDVRALEAKGRKELKGSLEMGNGLSLKNWTVLALAPGGRVLDRTLSDETGNFTFKNIPDGIRLEVIASEMSNNTQLRAFYDVYAENTSKLLLTPETTATAQILNHAMQQGDTPVHILSIDVLNRLTDSARRELGQNYREQAALQAEKSAEIGPNSFQRPTDQNFSILNITTAAYQSLAEKTVTHFKEGLTATEVGALEELIQMELFAAYTKSSAAIKSLDKLKSGSARALLTRKFRSKTGGSATYDMLVAYGVSLMKSDRSVTHLLSPDSSARGKISQNTISTAISQQTNHNQTLLNSQLSKATTINKIQTQTTVVEAKSAQSLRYESQLLMDTLIQPRGNTTITNNNIEINPTINKISEIKPLSETQKNSLTSVQNILISGTISGAGPSTDTNTTIIKLPQSSGPFNLGKSEPITNNILPIGIQKNINSVSLSSITANTQFEASLNWIITPVSVAPIVTSSMASVKSFKQPTSNLNSFKELSFHLAQASPPPQPAPQLLVAGQTVTQVIKASLLQTELQARLLWSAQNVPGFTGVELFISDTTGKDRRVISLDLEKLAQLKEAKAITLDSLTIYPLGDQALELTLNDLWPSSTYQVFVRDVFDAQFTQPPAGLAKVSDLKGNPPEDAFLLPPDHPSLIGRLNTTDLQPPRVGLAVPFDNDTLLALPASDADLQAWLDEQILITQARIAEIPVGTFVVPSRKWQLADIGGYRVFYDQKVVAEVPRRDFDTYRPDPASPITLTLKDTASPLGTLSFELLYRDTGLPLSARAFVPLGAGFAAEDVPELEVKAFPVPNNEYTQIQLAFAGIPGATQYRVYVDNRLLGSTQGEAGQALSFKAEGLSPDTRYEFRVEADRSEDPISGLVSATTWRPSSSSGSGGGGNTAVITPPVVPAAPTITNLSASNGTIGSAVTITGTGFDTTPGNNTVRFGTTTATVNTASATSLNVTVPAGIFGSQNVTVTVAGQTNAGTNNYAVTPAITGFTAAATSSDVAGASITINGSGFHTTLGSNTVSFGGTNATVTGATATALTVTVPALTSNAAPYATTVQVGAQISAGSNFTVMPRITTFAGSTQGFSGDNGAAANAQLNAPWGVSINASNHVAIADSSNHRIRFVPASNGDFFGVTGMTAGNIYTLAGNGTGAFAGDNGAGTSAQVNDPHGIALIGNILLTFADTANQRVRTLSNTTATFYNIAMTAGSVYTVNGSGTNGAATDGAARFTVNMASPEGVADQGNGTLIADTGNNVAYFSNLLTGPATRFGRTVAGSNIYFVAGGGFGGSALNSPSGIHRVANATNGGHVYIADAGSHRIFFRPDTAGNYFGQAMAADTLYVIAGDGNTGATGDGGSATSARLSSPRGVFANATGVFIADTGNHKIRFIPITSGNYYGQAMTANFIYTLAGTGAAALAGDNSIAGLAQLNNPTGVSVDSTGQVYVADRLNHRVRRISP